MTNQSLPEIPEIIEKDYGRIVRYPDGIICLYMRDNISIDLTKGEEMVADVSSVAQAEQIRLLISFGENTDLTFKAQWYFAAVPGYTHVALLVNSRMQASVGQFLVKLYQTLKSDIEYHLFHETESAFLWLQQKKLNPPQK